MNINNEQNNFSKLTFSFEKLYEHVNNINI